MTSTGLRLPGSCWRSFNVIIWWGWDYSVRGRVQSMSGLESISMFWGYVAMPVGGLFAIFGIIGNLLDPQRNELETAQ